MGRNSGGVVNTQSKGKKAQMVRVAIQASKPLSSIKDRATYKEIFKGISRFESVMGVKEKSVRIAPLQGAYGVTYIQGNGKSAGILLDSKFFDRKKAVVEKEVVAKNYDTGFKSKTRAPLQHTVTHELAHATWNASMTSKNAREAGKEIKQLYNEFKSSSYGKTTGKGHGRYGRTTVSEFWSETVTKAIHGDQDRYTRAVKRIAKKYNL